MKWKHFFRTSLSHYRPVYLVTWFLGKKIAKNVYWNSANHIPYIKRNCKRFIYIIFQGLTTKMTPEKPKFWKITFLAILFIFIEMRYPLSNLSEHFTYRVFLPSLKKKSAKIYLELSHRKANWNGRQYRQTRDRAVCVGGVRGWAHCYISSWQHESLNWYFDWLEFIAIVSSDVSCVISATNPYTYTTICNYHEGIVVWSWYMTHL